MSRPPLLRQELFAIPANYGVAGQLLQAIIDFYEFCEAAVLIEGSVWPVFTIEVDVWHCCPLSPFFLLSS